jgi:DNA-binding beta-propeller fold protein YncE
MFPFSFSRWLKAMNRQPGVSPWDRARRRPPRARFLPRLEGLEDRAVPSCAQDVLYISDTAGNTVQRFDATTGAFLDTLAKGNKSLHGPQGLLYVEAGAPGIEDDYVLVANQNANRGKPGEILKYDAATGEFIDELVPFQDPNAPFAPRGMILSPDGTVLYVADLEGAVGGSGRIATYDVNSGEFLGDLDFTDCFSGRFNPRGLVFGPDGALYVSGMDTSAGKKGVPLNPNAGYILRFDVSQGTCSVFAFNDGDNIQEPGETEALHRPEGLVFGPDGNLYVTSFRANPNDTDKILVFGGQTGNLIDRIDLYQQGEPRAFAQALLFGPDGNLFVPISNTGEVRRYDLSGEEPTYTTFIGPGILTNPTFLTFGQTNPSTLAYECLDGNLASTAAGAGAVHH